MNNKPNDKKPLRLHRDTLRHVQGTAIKKTVYPGSCAYPTNCYLTCLSCTCA